MRGDLTMEPRFRQALLASDGRDRDSQSLGSFFRAETTEKTQFDDPGLAFIDDSESVQRVVERFNLGMRPRRKTHRLLYGYFLCSTASFGAYPPPRVIYQNLPHQVRRNAEEMRTAFPIRQVLRNQPHIRL